jgi:hypothetical protein
VDLSKQLHAISLGQVAPITSVSLTPSKPSKLFMIVASLWFLSLILALGSALFGILVKQWYHEYIRWTTVFPVQHAVHVRHYRFNDLRRWRSHTMVSIMTAFLEVALALFFVGLAILLWEVNDLAAHVVTISVGVVLFVAVSLSVLPSIMPRLPYRTFLGSAILNASRFVRKVLAMSLAYVLALFIPENSTSYRNSNPFSYPLKGSQKVLEVLRRVSDAPPVPHWQDYDTWMKSDILHRLPQTAKDVAIDKAKILVWLFAHRTVPEDLFTQCISDIPGPPLVHLPKNKLKESGWVASGTDKDYLNFRLPYLSFCEILYGLMKSDRTLPKALDKVNNFQDILAMLFPELNPLTDKPIRPSKLLYAFDERTISRLSKSIRSLDNKLKYAFSNYLLSSMQTLLESQVSYSRVQEDTDKFLGVTVDFLCLLLLFRFDEDLSSSDSSTFSYRIQVGRRAYYPLQLAFDRIVGQDQSRPRHLSSQEIIRIQNHRDRAIICMAVGMSSPLLDLVKPQRFNSMSYSPYPHPD